MEDPAIRFPCFSNPSTPSTIQQSIRKGEPVPWLYLPLEPVTHIPDGAYPVRVPHILLDLGA